MLSPVCFKLVGPKTWEWINNEKLTGFDKGYYVLEPFPDEAMLEATLYKVGAHFSYPILKNNVKQSKAGIVPGIEFNTVEKGLPEVLQWVKKNKANIIDTIYLELSS